MGTGVPITYIDQIRTTMKSFDINAYCMDELSIQEAQSTDGGSITILLVCAAAALLLGSCQDYAIHYVEINGNRHNNEGIKNGDQ